MTAQPDTLKGVTQESPCTAFRKLTQATDDFYRAALGLGWTEEDLADRKEAG